MPFSFPDDTYTSDDKDVTKVIFFFFLGFVLCVCVCVCMMPCKKNAIDFVVFFVQVIQLVHSIRQEVRRDDRSKVSTMIWQANKSHYIHKYLHKNVIMHVSSADRTVWV